jgi:hypothetical protein
MSLSQYRRACALLLVIVSALVLAVAVNGQTPANPVATQSPSPMTVSMEVGTTKAVAGMAFDKSSVKSEDSGAVDLDTAEKIKATKVGTVTFKATQGGANVEVTVKINKIKPTIVLTRTRPATDKLITSADGSAAVRVVSGDIYTLSVQHHGPDGDLFDAKFVVSAPSDPGAPLKFDQSSRAITFVDPPAAKKLVNAPPVDASLVISLEQDGTNHTLPFEIVEKPDNVSVDVPVVVHEDVSQQVNVIVTGTAGGTYQSSSAVSTSQYAYDCARVELKNADATPLSNATVSNGKLSIGRFDLKNTSAATAVLATLKIRCTAKVIDRNDTSHKSDDVSIKITPSGGSIRFVPPSMTITAGDSAQITAAAVDRLGGETQRPVVWSLVEPTEAATITQDASNTVTLVTVSDPVHLPSNGILKLRATVAATSDAPEITADLPVRIAFPTGFTFVRGSLEMIDAQTAHDLYGPATARDFFIAKITILNDLKDDPREHNAGASILVFSSSLAIGVNLEKNDGLTDVQRKQLREARTADDAIALKRSFEKQQGWRFHLPGRDSSPEADDPIWHPIEPEDLRVLGLPTAYPLQQSRLVPGPEGRSPKAAPIYTCDDVWYAEQAIDVSKGCPEGDAACVSRIRAEHDNAVAAARLRQLHYRPYPYDLVVKSFDPRDNRTARAITFRALTFAGALAAFVTGVPNFGASKQFIAVNEKFGNVLVPGLAALWPNLRETQRQNLITDTMHPIEEVPFGSSLTKVVFLPKYPFQGFRANTWFRISEICPFDFQVEVAVAPKRQPITPTTVGSPSAGAH